MRPVTEQEYRELCKTTVFHTDPTSQPSERHPSNTVVNTWASCKIHEWEGFYEVTNTIDYSFSPGGETLAEAIINTVDFWSSMGENFSWYVIGARLAPGDDQAEIRVSFTDGDGEKSFCIDVKVYYENEYSHLAGKRLEEIFT